MNDMNDNFTERPLDEVAYENTETVTVATPVKSYKIAERGEREVWLTPSVGTLTLKAGGKSIVTMYSVAMYEVDDVIEDLLGDDFKLVES